MDFLILLPVAIIPAILLGQIYVLGRKMSEPEKMLRRIDGGLSEFQLQAISHYKDWLASVNLEYRANFQFGKIAGVVFQQGDLPRFLTIMFHQKLTFSAESYLADLTILDTSTSGNIGLFPRPGAYAQSFVDLPLAETWQRHLEGEAYLSQKFGYRWTPLKESYLDILPRAMRLRLQYNRAQFLWPFRVLYRFFVTRFQIRNKTIAQQFP